MIQTISKGQFRDAFSNMDRGEQFSYEALGALYDYLGMLEEDCDMTIELDPIAFCCEYTEYSDLEEFQGDYSDEYETIEDIENCTTVIPVSGDSFIIQQF